MVVRIRQRFIGFRHFGLESGQTQQTRLRGSPKDETLNDGHQFAQSFSLTHPGFREPDLRALHVVYLARPRKACQIGKLNMEDVHKSFPL